jgi:hypothetical protein
LINRHFDQFSKTQKQLPVVLHRRCSDTVSPSAGLLGSVSTTPQASMLTLAQHARLQNRWKTYKIVSQVGNIGRW